MCCDTTNLNFCKQAEASVCILFETRGKVCVLDESAEMRNEEVLRNYK